MTDDLDAALAATTPAPEAARTVVRSERRCGRHQWAANGVRIVSHATYPPVETFASTMVEVRCSRCRKLKDPIRSKRGKTSRDYGNRAELKVARTYGGEKVGHHGGPVDVRGKDWATQVKTHRRLPPAEWRAVFANLEASTDRLPRLLLRFVHDGGPTDYIVVPGKAWLDWFGKDE